MKLTPTGIVAPIVSIEAVLDDPESELEAQIAEHYGDACVVEMEGYGAVHAASRERVPSIVVRGVSDMTQAKSWKGDAKWQPLAACNAAAFAFEMLTHWARAYPPDTLYISVVSQVPAVHSAIPDYAPPTEHAPIGTPDSATDITTTEVKSQQSESSFVEHSRSESCAPFQ